MKTPPPTQPWHALLAPLPPDAIPRRQPVATPEIQAKPEAAAIAGWEQLTVDLSAGAAGLRIVMVLLDAAGQPIVASDAVLYRMEATEGGGADPRRTVEYLHESVGGRLEPDGTFRGARWRMVGVETVGRDPAQWESTPVEPSEADVAALKALVADVLRRRPSEA